MKIPGIIDDNGNQIDFVDKGAPHVETANVGDVIVVKAVDENGVPTEWEASGKIEESDKRLFKTIEDIGLRVIEPDYTTIDIETTTAMSQKTIDIQIPVNKDVRIKLDRIPSDAFTRYVLGLIGEKGNEALTKNIEFTDSEWHTVTNPNRDRVAIRITVYRSSSEKENYRFYFDPMSETNGINIKTDLAKKIDKPSDAPVVGNILKVLSVNPDGTFVCEWAEESKPDLTGYVKDTDYAREGKTGVVNTHSTHGHYVDLTGRIYNVSATDSDINSRVNENKIISPKNLEYAVTSVIDFEEGSQERVTFVEESDLEHYVKNTDYATQDVGGVVRMSTSLGTQLGSTGVLQGSTRSLSSYETGSNNTIISKGTLENVLADRIKQNVFIIQEEDLEVSYDDTKGVAPYSSSYGYTNIVIKADAGIKWIDGAIYLFNLSNTLATSTNRNGRIKIEGEDTWHPITNSSGAILAAHSFLIKSVTKYFKYSTRYIDYGALGIVNDDNTTYSYLVNTLTGDGTDSPVTIDSDGYGARYSLIFPTTPITDLNEKYSSLVKSSSTGSTKVATSGKFYIDRTPLYVYSGNINAGNKAINAVYQYYAGMDARYTVNTKDTYMTRSKKCFLWLKNFDEYDMSFESDATVGNIMTIDRLATRFPSTMTEDVYLYFLGWTQANWYAIVPNTTDMLTFYKYVPSTQTLTKITPKGLTEKKWELKGMIVDANDSLYVDLSDCTELYVKGLVIGTGLSSLTSNISTLLYGVSIAGGSERRIYGNYITVDDSLVPIQGRYTAPTSIAMGNTLATYVWYGKTVKDITRIYLSTPENVTSCEIEVYAR